MAPFIARCAESLLSQTLEEVEFIFVDDASPDQSGDILQEVVRKYPRRNVQIIRHKVNKGLPAARNTGLSAARGAFIYHCDSDDYLETGMLEKMYAAAMDSNADFVYCDFFLTYETGERYMGNPDFTAPGQMLREGFLAGTMKYNVWNKLVAKSLYDKGGVRFPEGHSMGEDMTMIRLSFCSRRCAHVKEALYHYVKINGNAFSNTFTEQHLEDIRFNAAATLDFLDTVGIQPQWAAFFKLNIKLPFLFSEDKRQYLLWNEWYPEANPSILQNTFLPVRTRMVQWMAWKGLFPLVSLYTFLVNHLFYKRKFRK